MLRGTDLLSPSLLSGPLPAVYTYSSTSRRCCLYSSNCRRLKWPRAGATTGGTSSGSGTVHAELYLSRDVRDRCTAVESVFVLPSQAFGISSPSCWVGAESRR